MAHRIYYIEDDAGIAEGVAFFLRRKGFEVITAATVAEGKQLLGKGPGRPGEAIWCAVRFPWIKIR